MDEWEKTIQWHALGVWLAGDKDKYNGVATDRQCIPKFWNRHESK